MKDLERECYTPLKESKYCLESEPYSLATKLPIKLIVAVKCYYRIFKIIQIITVKLKLQFITNVRYIQQMVKALKHMIHHKKIYQ